MSLKSEARRKIIEEFELGSLVRPHLRHKKGRTPLQRVIEDCEYMDLEEILESYEPQVLADKYHLDLSTISKWKVRLGWWSIEAKGGDTDDNGTGNGTGEVLDTANATTGR